MASLAQALNEPAIERGARYDSHYRIITSEVDMRGGAIIDTCRGLWKIEESFRTIKGNLGGVPRALLHGDPHQGALPRLLHHAPGHAPHAGGRGEGDRHVAFRSLKHPAIELGQVDHYSGHDSLVWHPEANRCAFPTFCVLRRSRPDLSKLSTWYFVVAYRLSTQEGRLKCRKSASIFS